jgi:hypothetical protein
MVDILMLICVFMTRGIILVDLGTDIRGMLYFFDTCTGKWASPVTNIDANAPVCIPPSSETAPIKKSSIGGGAIAGIVIGSILVIALATVAALRLRKPTKKVRRPKSCETLPAYMESRPEEEAVIIATPLYVN